MFQFTGKWKKTNPDRLSRLAEAIEAIGERDRRLIDEAGAVDRLRSRGALELHAICSDFVGRINAKLAEPALILDPPDVAPDYFREGIPSFFQINLRGRLIQFQFAATEELYGRDDFRQPYVLRGAMRSFNQDTLRSSCVDEQLIFYSPHPAGKQHSDPVSPSASWYFVDPRTHRTGPVGEDYLISALERIL